MEILLFLYAEWMKVVMDPRNMRVEAYYHMTGQWQHLLAKKPGKTWDGMMFNTNNYGVSQTSSQHADSWNPFLPDRWRFTTFLTDFLNGNIDADNHPAFNPFVAFVVNDAIVNEIEYEKYMPGYVSSEG